MTKFYWITFLFVFSPYLCKAQKENQSYLIDSLKREISCSKTDTTKIKLLNDISYIYSKFNFEEGIKYAQQAEALAISVAWKKGIADANLFLGLNNVAKCNYPKAIQHYLKSLDLYNELAYKQGMGSVYANMGLLYLAKSDYAKTLEYDYKALSILEGLTNIRAKAIVLENIGTVYLEQKKYSKTLEYYSLALEIYKKIGDKQGISRNLGNQGIILNGQENHNKALTYHLLALKASEESGDEASIQINLENVGITYCYLEKFPIALFYHLKALDLSRKLKDSRNIAINLGNTGELYYLMAKDSFTQNNGAENLNEAITYLNSAIIACKDIQFYGPYIEFCKFLSDAYVLKNNYKKALEVFKEYALTSDTIFSQEARLKITDLEMKRQIDLENKNIVLKNRQIQIENLQLRNKQNERVIFLVSIALLFITIFLLYRLFRLRNKTHKRILSDIANIQAHEVRAPLARILGLTKLFDHTNPSAEINKQVINYINESALELDKVVRKTVDKASE